MRKTDQRELWKLVGRLGLLVLAVFLSYLGYVYIYHVKVEPPARYNATNEGAVSYSLYGQMQMLSQNEDLSRLAFEGREKEREYGTYVIPGLKYTRTLLTEEGPQSAVCSSMTPQGVAVTEEYVLVSAYCRTGKHNSVIYVLNKETHRFLKELVLPGKPHAGGVAYDPDHERIWYSAHDQGIAQAVCFSLDTLKEYNFAKEHLPISVQSVFLYGVIRDSFLTYRDGSLYVGYFSRFSEGTLARYEIDDEGNLATENDISLGMDLDMAMPEETGSIPPCVQGMAFYGDYLIFSQSYGFMPSKLVFYELEEEICYQEIDMLHGYRMPERMEQICVEGDQLYVLFESAAYAYRASSVNIVDRVLKLNLIKTLEDIQAVPGL